MSTTLTLDMIGRKVSFRSKNASDEITWSGTITSIGSYALASKQFDVTSYNAAVRQVDPSVSSDPTKLTYFTLTLDNTTASQSAQVFAAEWILDGSFTYTDLAALVTITVRDQATADHTRILSLLRSGNYQDCTIVSVQTNS